MADVTEAVRDCGFRCVLGAPSVPRVHSTHTGLRPALGRVFGTCLLCNLPREDCLGTSTKFSVAGARPGATAWPYRFANHCLVPPLPPQPAHLACAAVPRTPVAPALPSVRCRVFAGAVASGGIVKGMRVPDGKAISNARVKPKGDVSSESFGN
jgi:hypothetical protein